MSIHDTTARQHARLTAFIRRPGAWKVQNILWTPEQIIIRDGDIIVREVAGRIAEASATSRSGVKRLRRIKGRAV